MNKTILTLSAITLGAGMLLVTNSSTLAYRGDPNVQGPNYTAERHEAMTAAFENNDYNAWKELKQGNGRISQIINEGNFSKYSEMHKLTLAGDIDGANTIRTELGLGLGDGLGQGQKRVGYGRNANR